MGKKVKNYYEVLGAPKDASQDDIKKSYRALAIKYHPDKNQGDKEAEDRFKEISEAYEILGDPDKRNDYDHQSTRGHDQFSFFGGGGQWNVRTQENLNLFSMVNLTFEEVVSGITKDIEYERSLTCKVCNGKKTTEENSTKKCPQCSGKGFVIIGNGVVTFQNICPSCGGEKVVITNPCKNCKGNGRVSEHAKVTGVAIPAGINPNAKIICKGRGHQSIISGNFGDLVIGIGYIQHSLFKLRQNPDNGLFDTVMELNVPFHIALTGGKLKVPTLYGTKEINIKPGMEIGSIETISGCGLPSTRNGVGDQILVMNMEIPKKISEKLMKELKKINISDDEYPKYCESLKFSEK